MKKIYKKPLLQAVQVEILLMQDTSTTTGGVHTDDPQPPGGALSRNRGWLDDDEN